jgi:hypothetical protein
MTVDPRALEATRRLRRDLRVARSSTLALGTQGLLLAMAVDHRVVVLWVIWVVVLVTLLTAFILESRRERARRRRASLT